MQKVVSINLNGNAYQLEDPGYEALRAYLQRAESRLEANPDRAEIMGDLEQAIAEKCGRYLGPNKTVVTAAEMQTIIAEMGPVESPEEATAPEGAPAGGADAAEPGMGKDGPKRLYQIREGAMVSGVCNGIAAFFDIDVTAVRVVFVLLAFVTFGAWVLAYLIMAILIPYADTPEARAAAYGLHLKAQELLDQANWHRASRRARREWRRTWRRQQRAWRRNWSEQCQQYADRHWRHRWAWHWQQWQQHMTRTQAAAAPMGALGHVLTGITLPVIAVANAALFVGGVLVIMSAAMTGAIFGWPLPAGLPVWGSLLILCAIYLVLTSPLRAARHGAHLAWGPYYHTWAALSSMLWISFTVLFFWLAYWHVPQVHALLDHLPTFWQNRRISLAV